MKKLFALIMTIALVFGVISISASAEETSENIIINDGQTVFIFENGLSSEMQNRFIADYYNLDDDGAETYGLTCTLLGHKLESTTAITITHKVRTSAPRCLREYYTHEACSRCDYSNSTLFHSEYISCC